MNATYDDCDGCGWLGRVPLYDTDRGTAWEVGCIIDKNPEDCEYGHPGE